MCCTWNIQNFLLNLTYVSVPEKEDLFQARILGCRLRRVPLFQQGLRTISSRENNKSHKTNSHNELDFLLTLNERFFLYGFKNRICKNLMFTENFRYKKTLISKAKREKLCFRCFCCSEKVVAAVLQYFIISQKKTYKWITNDITIRKSLLAATAFL